MNIQEAYEKWKPYDKFFLNENKTHSVSVGTMGMALRDLWQAIKEAQESPKPFERRTLCT